VASPGLEGGQVAVLRHSNELFITTFLANFRECPECEVRLIGFLGSSASQRGTLQGKEGYVVLLFPTLPYEGVKFFQEEVT
jgi:hypothetical protein